MNENNVCKFCMKHPELCECECKVNGEHHWEWHKYIAETRHSPEEGGYRDCIYCDEVDENYNGFDEREDYGDWLYDQKKDEETENRSK